MRGARTMDENILRFQIQVDDVSKVEIIEGVQQLEKDPEDFVQIAAHLFEESASVHVLAHQEGSSFLNSKVFNGRNVGVGKGGQDPKFLIDPVRVLIRPLPMKKFQGHRAAASLPIVTEISRRRGPVS